MPPFMQKWKENRPFLIPPLIIFYFALGLPYRWPSSLGGAVSWSVIYGPMWAAAPHQYKMQRHDAETPGLQTEFMCRKATVWAKLKDPGCGPVSPACLTTPELRRFCNWPKHPHPGGRTGPQHSSFTKFQTATHNYLQIIWCCSLRNPPVQLMMVLFINSMQCTYVSWTISLEICLVERRQSDGGR